MRLITHSQPPPSFTVLEATESWAGPGNEMYIHKIQVCDLFYHFSVSWANTQLYMVVVYWLVYVGVYMLCKLAHIHKNATHISNAIL